MSEKDDVLILAIESSCDETAAAVVKNGREVLSNVINTQIAIHTECYIWSWACGSTSCRSCGG